MRACSKCGVALGPWEDDPCLTCAVRRPVHWLSNADAALLIVEQEERPVSTYDVIRGIRREFGWTISMASIAAALAGDLRFCWGGRSLYGLYRHGLFPGPRNLAGVAKLFLYSHAAPLDTELLAFVMRFGGYRFQQASLRQALDRDPDVKWKPWAGWRVSTNWTTRAMLRKLGVGPTNKVVDEMALRCADLMRRALREHTMRRAGGYGLCNEHAGV